MSFVDNIKRREQQRRRVATWTRAVRQLNWFIRQYLRKSANSSTLTIKPELVRVDGSLLDRLTVWMDGETVVVTPLALTDTAVPESGGCVMIRSTNGVCYTVLWNGEAPGLQDQWQIGRTDGRTESDEVEFAQLMVSFDERWSKLAPLSESSLDEALDALFGDFVAIDTTPPIWYVGATLKTSRSEVRYEPRARRDRTKFGG
jgi:hypothetical protein